ncbi:conserved hypothetical protein (plasmid) [Methylobacterium radiotolerans JCM 2831]|uniref:Uncharacterized protein n=1 Tax=Methylobacterium radiotolerans (strain ATCC 27329 / DSM 1819 / JCM 2831 / NBRC 15690 / NCIMB 10815 / 0-1) TaxID=426355 RepID=B1M909_METRJ|nr:conserved hypothetical protein [Methylobacterium radiotolerans JCM 2831]OXE43396.1 hypothetical protein CCS92_03455 [Methylobacterium radiotolerans]
MGHRAMTGRCKHCRHWQAPSAEEQRAYEWFHLGLSRHRVRRPTGACDRNLIGHCSPPAFSATTAEFDCRNLEASPPPLSQRGGGLVTVGKVGHVVWQGREEEIPARFLQTEFDL